MPESRLLTQEEAAEYLNTSKSHVRRLWDRRELAAVKVGNLVRFDLADLDRYIESRRTEAVR